MAIPWTTTQIAPVIANGGVTQDFTVNTPSSYTGPTVTGAGASAGTDLSSWGLYILYGAIAYFAYQKLR